MFARIFDKVYPVDGVPGTLHNFDEDRRSNWLNRLSSFIGLPNRIYDQREGQSTENLLRNFLGAQKNTTQTKLNINLILSPFFFYFNLIKLPFALFSNIVKLVTEALPLLLIELCNKGLERVTSTITESNHYAFVLLLGFLALHLARIAGYALLFLGRAMTSPINNIKDVWAIRDILHSPPHPVPLFLATVVSLMIITMSILITLTSYIILFPAAIKLIAAPLIHSITTNASAGLVHFVHSIQHTLEPFLNGISSIFSPLANVVGSIVTMGKLQVANLLANFNEALIGFVALTSLAITCVGTPASKLYDWLVDEWRKPFPAPPPSAPEIPIGGTHAVVGSRLPHVPGVEQREVPSSTEETKREFVMPSQPIEIPIQKPIADELKEYVSSVSNRK